MCCFPGGKPSCGTWICLLDVRNRMPVKLRSGLVTTLSDLKTEKCHLSCILTQTMPTKCPSPHNRATEPPSCRSQAFRRVPLSWCRPLCTRPQEYPRFAALNSQICFYLCNEGFMHCTPSIIFLTVWLSLWLFLLKQSDYVMHWHSTSFEDELLLCFSLHITLMHEHHSHQMCAVDNNLLMCLPQIYMQWLQSLFLLKHEPVELSLWRKPRTHNELLSKPLRSFFVLSSSYKIRVNCTAFL